METMPPEKILIIDDNIANIDLLVDALGGGYDYSISMSGIDALTIIDEEVPDLVLLDILMPGMDGYEVCRVLKSDEKTADIPIIFVTAKSSVEDEQKGLEIGAVDYISKPFSPPIVRARVKNHLLIKRQREALKKNIEELQEKNDKLDMFNQLFVDREFRIKQLRDEVVELKNQLYVREEPSV